jgi:hypothetical protein
MVAAIISSGEESGIVQTLQYHKVVFTQLGKEILNFSLYQERAVFGEMKMDPGKRAQTLNTCEVSSLEWSFPNPLI